MISMNKDTGLAEVSSKVNNIAEAWRRMNDFIGNKILVSTGRFTDWIEELNNPENLAVFETTLSNIWTGIENGAALIGKVGSAFGELSSKSNIWLEQYAGDYQRCSLLERCFTANADFSSLERRQLSID